MLLKARISLWDAARDFFEDSLVQHGILQEEGNHLPASNWRFQGDTDVQWRVLEPIKGACGWQIEYGFERINTQIVSAQCLLLFGFRPDVSPQHVTHHDRAKRPQLGLVYRPTEQNTGRWFFRILLPLSTKTEMAWAKEHAEAMRAYQSIGGIRNPLSHGIMIDEEQRLQPGRHKDVLQSLLWIARCRRRSQ